MTSVNEGHQSEARAEARGYGKCRIVLGQGASGMFGHVALFVQVVPQAGYYSVEWRVVGADLAEDAQRRVEKASEQYARSYTAHREVGLGLRVAIVEVTSDEIRRNDYERAVNLAFREALEDTGLPTPQIFGP